MWWALDDVSRDLFTLEVIVLFSTKSRKASYTISLDIQASTKAKP